MTIGRGDEAYNLHSTKVLADARKSLGLRANSREYRNMVFRLIDYDADYIDEVLKNPGEIVAYAIDHESVGRGNELSAAIAERF